MRVVRSESGTYQAPHSLGSRSAVDQTSFPAAVRVCLGTDSHTSSFAVSRSGAAKTEVKDRPEEVLTHGTHLLRIQSVPEGEDGVRAARESLRPTPLAVVASKSREQREGQRARGSRV